MGHSASRAHKDQRTTLASKVGVSGTTLSAKIRKVMREEPGKSRKAAIGKAAGILAGQHGRRF